VLLGASNVRRGLDVALDTARRVLGGPLDVFAAYGLGRSYGQRRSVLGRALPGIAECGLWQALGRKPSVPTTALVTDVGNDLLYDVPVPDIAAWVGQCLDRLFEARVRVVMTPLPLCSITTLSTARFLAMRSILFPRCRFSLATVRERALDLDERLRQLARERGVVLAEHKPEWYRFDPIHVRRRYLARAWEELLSGWTEAAPLEVGVRRAGFSPFLVDHGLKPALRTPHPWGALRRWLYLQRLPPERHWLFGRERGHAQPAAVLADGTTLSVY
jgi:hypothetical protein